MRRQAYANVLDFIGRSKRVEVFDEHIVDDRIEELVKQYPQHESIIRKVKDGYIYDEVTDTMVLDS